MSGRGLSGYWTGWYDYGGGRGRVPFSAMVEDRGGQVRGSTFEVDEQGRELSATLSGSHDGLTLDFVKRYVGRSDTYKEAIDYSGEIRDEGREVRGVWAIEVDASVFGHAFTYVGTFAMRRVSGGEAAAVMRSEAVDTDG